MIITRDLKGTNDSLTAPKLNREAGRNKFVKKGRVPDRDESFGKVDSSNECKVDGRK